MSDLTAPFTVDQACQGPLKQHKWGLVSLCQSMHNTETGRGKEVRGYKGTKVPGPSFRGRARLGGPAAQLDALASSRFKIRRDNRLGCQSTRPGQSKAGLFRNTSPEQEKTAGDKHGGKSPFTCHSSAPSFLFVHRADRRCTLLCPVYRARSVTPWMTRPDSTCRFALRRSASPRIDPTAFSWETLPQFPSCFNASRARSTGSSPRSRPARKPPTNKQAPAVAPAARGSRRPSRGATAPHPPPGSPGPRSRARMSPRTTTAPRTWTLPSSRPPSS